MYDIKLMSYGLAAVAVRCGGWTGRNIGFQVKKTKMQLGMPQMTLDPLLVREQFTRGTPLDHPFPVQDASNLPPEAVPSLLQGHGRIRFHGGGNPRIGEPRTERQPQQPAP